MENLEEYMNRVIQEEVDKRVAECRAPEVMRYLSSLSTEELQKKLLECRSELEHFGETQTQIYTATLKENIKILEEILNK